MAHNKTKCFKCPYCNFTAITSFAVQNHVRQVSKTDPSSHKKSPTCLTLAKLPADRYVGHVKLLAKVPTTSNYGILPKKRKPKTAVDSSLKLKKVIPNLANKMDQSPAISSSIVESSTEIGT